MELEHEELRRLERLMETQGRDDGEPPRAPMQPEDLLLSIAAIGGCLIVAIGLWNIAPDLVAPAVEWVAQRLAGVL